MRRISWRSHIVAALAASLLIVDGAARADDRAEIEGLKKQIEELKAADRERQKQLDEMMLLLRQLQPAAAAKAQPAKGARPARSAPPARAARARGPAAAPKQAAVAEPAPADAVGMGAPGRAAPRSDLDALDAAVSAAAAAPAAAPAPASGEAPPAQASGAPALASTVPPTGLLGEPGPSSVPGTLLYRPLPGQATLRLLEPSFDILMAGGGSTANNDEIPTLQGGAHDPNKRGFTLQQGELSLFGAVDPYFTGEAHIVFTPDGVELEEAFATTTRLPYDLTLEAGYFLTEFGRINPTHPHAWPWIDQPVVNTRMFGPDGLRSPGATLSWLLPTPLFSELYVGIQNADEGELTASFLDPEAVGNRPGPDLDVDGFEDMLYLVRSATAWNVNDETSMLFGVSGLFGPNSTGAGARTFIYGTDFTLKWRPVRNFRGWPFLIWQSELMKRDYTAQPFVAGTEVDDGGGGHDHGHATGLARAAQDDHDHDHDDEEGEIDESIPGALLRDWGFYSQLLYGFKHPWAVGLRAEWASGHGPSVGGRSNDPLRDDRLRISPLLTYQPSEFSRIRLQYNYDHATALPGEDASTVWLGLEILYGTHPAHKY